MIIRTKYFRTDKALAEYFTKHSATCVILAVYTINGYLCAVYNEYEGEIV